VAETVADPLQAALQVTLEDALKAADGPPLLLIVVETVCVQPAASVTWTE
jgi:hypothetical protein